MERARPKGRSRRATGQAERFYEVFTKLVRGYQYRDRERICALGLSVSQCHALEMLEEEGALTMGDLAGRLRLDGSTMTRLVDSLVSDGLARRVRQERDRRLCCVRITRKGRSLSAKVRARMVREYEEMLRQVPADSREAVVETIARLLEALRARSR